MSWLPVLLLAVLAFALAVVVLKLPRTLWTLFGSALLFGLTGYALQGHPGMAGAPAAPASQDDADTGELLVSARREFYPSGAMPSRFVVTADAFTRRGQHEQAANFLRNAVEENPNDSEAWLALGNALVEHADGQLTAAALYAYSQAEKIDPSNPAPTYFLGMAFLRAGEPGKTLALWRELLKEAPDDAEWRATLATRLERLEAILGIAPSPSPDED
ncbi:tetratricopeptide repeat protein [Qipengyuania sp.]|uniref:tetratricopeptide repeat protein n=1 Tax=Qipengyuania sp. TaxID=2004515 RepID=UPI003AF51F0E